MTAAVLLKGVKRSNHLTKWYWFFGNPPDYVLMCVFQVTTCTERTSVLKLYAAAKNATLFRLFVFITQTSEASFRFSFGNATYSCAGNGETICLYILLAHRLPFGVGRCSVGIWLMPKTGLWAARRSLHA